MNSCGVFSSGTNSPSQSTVNRSLREEGGKEANSSTDDVLVYLWDYPIIRFDARESVAVSFRALLERVFNQGI